MKKTLRNALLLTALGLSSSSVLAETTAPKMPEITPEAMAKAQSESAALFGTKQFEIEVEKSNKDAGSVLRMYEKNNPVGSVSASQNNMPVIAPEFIKQQDTNDYAKLAKQFYAGSQKNKTDGDDLVVFVSLSMPMASLQALAHQSTQYGAIMVFRGLKDNSLRATMLAMKSIAANENKVNMQVNPVVFSKLNITTVPTFAVIKGKSVSEGDSQACAPASAFMAISGDVPLAYALEKLAEGSPPDLAQIATAHIQQGSVRQLPQITEGRSLEEQ